MDSCKIFIGNVHESVRKQQLREIFGKYGEVTEIFVNNGFAFLTFDRPNAATHALDEMSGRVVNGQKIRIEPYVQKNRGGVKRGPNIESSRGRGYSNREFDNRRGPGNFEQRNYDSRPSSDYVDVRDTREYSDRGRGNYDDRGGNREYGTYEGGRSGGGYDDRGMRDGYPVRSYPERDGYASRPMGSGYDDRRPPSDGRRMEYDDRRPPAGRGYSEYGGGRREPPGYDSRSRSGIESRSGNGYSAFEPQDKYRSRTYEEERRPVAIYRCSSPEPRYEEVRGNYDMGGRSYERPRTPPQQRFRSRSPMERYSSRNYNRDEGRSTLDFDRRESHRGRGSSERGRPYVRGRPFRGESGARNDYGSRGRYRGESRGRSSGNRLTSSRGRSSRYQQERPRVANSTRDRGRPNETRESPHAEDDDILLNSCEPNQIYFDVESRSPSRSPRCAEDDSGRHYSVDNSPQHGDVAANANEEMNYDYNDDGGEPDVGDPQDALN